MQYSTTVQAPYQTGDIVTVWFEIDKVYVGRVESVDATTVTVHLFSETARPKVPMHLVRPSNARPQSA